MKTNGQMTNNRSNLLTCFYRSKDPTNSIKVLKEEATKENLEKLNNKIHTNMK